MFHAIRICLFLAFALPLSYAFGQGGADFISVAPVVHQQPPPFGITIAPQGTYSVIQGKTATKIDVEIGTTTLDKNGNVVFTPLPGYGPRAGSFGPNSTWTSAPYPGMASKTTYAIRGKLYAVQPPGGEMEVASAIKTVTTP